MKVAPEPLTVVDVELTKEFWSLEIRADIPGWECRSHLSAEMDGLGSLGLWFRVVGKVCERAVKQRNAINARASKET